jgi:rsbT co-antagonist protein RsbR
MSEESNVPAEVPERIFEILMILSEVALSNFDKRLPVLPEADPFGVLFVGVNEMVQTLAETNRQSEQFQRELIEKLETIEQQRAAIRDLSTPVIEVWHGVLCLPVVGVMDTSRSAEMTETLLSAIAEKRALCAIIDVTGIEVMDTATADHFVRMARSVRLLGCTCVITGISPSIAQTISSMGMDLSGVTTHRSLRDALFQYIDGNGGARSSQRRAPGPRAL